MKTDNSTLIETYLRRLGKAVTLIKSDGTATDAYAIINGAWTRQRLHFEERAALPGRYDNLYYYYIGPASLDVTALGEDDTLYADGKRYFFTHSEPVVVGGAVQYYRGLLRETEENDDVFSS